MLRKRFIDCKIKLTGRASPQTAAGFEVVLQLPLDRILFAAVRALVSLLGVTVQDVLWGVQRKKLVNFLNKLTWRNFFWY